MNVPLMNFHTHTTFCDGKESAEDMVKAALEKGFTRLGFSGHSYTAYDESYCMKKEEVGEYIKEIKRLREKYAGSIEIFCGVEQDNGSDYPTDEFEYVIGSVHSVLKDGVYYSVDDTAEVFEEAVHEGFGDDVYKFVKAYFEHEAEVIRNTGGDIIGHFDLITKFNQGGRYFDPMDKRYRYPALEAMEALLETERPFEINTGAMYKGLRNEPYPSIYLIKELFDRKGDIMLSSDSHDGNSIGYAFPEIAKFAAETGFRTVKVFSDNGFEDFILW